MQVSREYSKPVFSPFARLVKECGVGDAGEECETEIMIRHRKTARWNREVRVSSSNRMHGLESPRPPGHGRRM